MGFDMKLKDKKIKILKREAVKKKTASQKIFEHLSTTALCGLISTTFQEKSFLLLPQFSTRRNVCLL
jgi:hypothetical protein